ncbi:HEAT repeat domain-containing protein [Crocosphaera chwakensis]|uniref:Peptidoglycan-binding domain 1 n=1 Tax=Crocosphaera chwakensis CCY0110 TaxID=391612 RepID=A3IJZ1_9CHRO|nr:HEAT repeat domain-containing protein [Crocosphaera chwakensis]EAZ92980.1 Peptidoglycan-binding domain 1 [Crocosphaera chwakensis CCY0110]
MIYYRLFLLLLICLSYLSSPSLSGATTRPPILNERDRNEEIIAQGTTNNSTNSSSGANLSYDQAMQAGYKATQQKDYQTAQKQFKTALELRPNDLYAQQALQNVEFYLAKQSNPFTNLTGSSLVIWISLLVVVLAIGIGIWLFLRRVSNYSQDKFEGELLQPHKQQELAISLDEDKNFQEKISSNSDNNSGKQLERNNSLLSPQTHEIASKNASEVFVETSKPETALPIQTPTRISSGDPIETLLEELRESDPKKRRQAIWKLAQTADSRAMNPLVDLMIDTDSQERSLILEALSQISARTLKPMNHALTLSLHDKNPQVRKNAIRDLTRIYELMSQISQLLCHAIDDSDREVQETARWAINQLNTQIPPRLDILTGDNSSEVTVEQSYSDTMD